MKLGRIEYVDLREIWPNEAWDFTPWLANEGLSLISETLGIDLDAPCTEKAVEEFSADILCTDASTGRYVVIENQLAGSDHDHLGKLIAYAAGLDATTLIWIAKEFRESHRAAIDWLNENTNTDLHLFALQIEAIRIGNSDPAPNFRIIAQPNDWSKTVKQSAGAKSGELSETQRLQYEFWTGFQEYMKEHSSIKTYKAKPSHFFLLGFQRTGFNLGAVASSYSETHGYDAWEIRVILSMENEWAPRYFKAISARSQEIESTLKTSLTWYERDNVRARRISISKNVGKFERERWQEFYEWLKTWAEEFRRVFYPIATEVTAQVQRELETSPSSEN